MKTKTKLALIIIVIVALVTVGTVAAQEITQDDPLVDCSTLGVGVSGTVVGVVSGAVEGTWVVTINTGTLECNVILENVSGGHPIELLLGQHFGNVTGEALQNALNTISVCVAPKEDDPTVYEIVDCSASGSQTAKIISHLESGAFEALIFGTSTTVMVEAKQEEADKLDEALETLMVDWELEDNTVVQSSEEIAKLHEEDKLGFGVIVKLLGMAEEIQKKCETQISATEISETGIASIENPCDDPVQFLVDQFKSGTGMGQLFKEYGKPALLGVGHVRKAAAEMTNGDEDGDSGEGETPTSTKFNGLGRGHGNTSTTPPGLAKKNKDTSTETTVQEPASSSSHPGNGKGPSKENPGKGNGKGKNKGKP